MNGVVLSAIGIAAALAAIVGLYEWDADRQLDLPGEGIVTIIEENNK